jgi:hypothetical protein
VVFSSGVDVELTVIAGEFPLGGGIFEGFVGKWESVEFEVGESVGLAVVGFLPMGVNILMAFCAALGECILSRELVEFGEELLVFRWRYGHVLGGRGSFGSFPSGFLRFFLIARTKAEGH